MKVNAERLEWNVEIKISSSVVIINVVGHKTENLLASSFVLQVATV
jgi:hypothetical protein